MAGVDIVHQYLCDYSIAIKRRQSICIIKKNIYIFFQLLDQMILNSFIIYKKQGGRKSHLVFRLDLVDALLEEYHSSENFPKRGCSSSEDNPKPLIERNFLKQIPA